MALSTDNISSKRELHTVETGSKGSLQTSSRKRQTSKQLHKLENLTQKPNQSVRMFIEKINNTYNSIYDDTNNQNLSMKNDFLVNILLKGVHKPIKTLMVLNQLLPEVTTWEEAQKAAIRCENTLYKTQASGGTLELPNLSTSNANTLTTTLIQQQQNR